MLFVVPARTSCSLWPTFSDYSLLCQDTNRYSWKLPATTVMKKLGISISSVKWCKRFRLPSPLVKVMFFSLTLLSFSSAAIHSGCYKHRNESLPLSLPLYSITENKGCSGYSRNWVLVHTSKHLVNTSGKETQRLLFLEIRRYYESDIFSA